MKVEQRENSIEKVTKSSEKTQNCGKVHFRLSTKKNLFPVQRVAVIVASRAATIFSPHSFFVGKFCSFLKKQFVFAKMKKSLQSHLFLVTRPLHRKQNFFYSLA